MNKQAYDLIDTGNGTTIKRWKKRPKKDKFPRNRSCPKCGQTKPIADYLTANGDKMYSRCHPCRTKDQREQRAKARHKRLSTRNVKSMLLQQYGSKCERCGYNEFESALDFHHKNPRDKDSSVSRLISIYAKHQTENNTDQLQAEISKCIILCANCHRALHAKDW